MDVDNIAESIPGRHSRREFLRRAGYLSAAGVAAPWALDLAGIAALPVSASDSSGYRALVCVFLHGGNDNANTVVPFDAASYNTYAQLRGSIAHPHATLLPLGQPEPATGRQVAFSPRLAGLHALFNSGDAAVVANVGPLRWPLTKAQYTANPFPSRRPPALFSHNDQQSLWQASAPEGARSGWGGRIGDIMLDRNGADTVFTCISTAGNAVMLSGREALQLQVSPDGVTRLTTSMPPDAGLLPALAEVMRLDTSGMFPSSYTTVAARALDTSGRLDAAVQTATAPTTFPTSSLGRQLAMVSRLIVAGRNQLGVRRQVFFVSVGGFDTHTNLEGFHPTLLGGVNASLTAFHAEMVRLGVSEEVTAFTSSDFGRALSINGEGSDHGWGAHHVVVGGAVRGGQVFGRLPMIAVNGADDVGGGRLLPTLSVDQYAATFARWMGASSSDLPLILPNINRFASSDIGFMDMPTPPVPTTTLPPVIPVVIPPTTPPTPPPPSTPTPPPPPPATVSADGSFTVLRPARVVDTRSGVGGLSGRVPAESHTTFKVCGVGGVPSAGVSAVAVNVAVVDVTAPTYVTLTPTRPAGTPDTSTLNVSAAFARPNVARANATMVPVSADGTINVYNHSGELHLIVDVTGFYSTAASPIHGDLLNPMAPVRIVDSRRAFGVPGRVGAGQTVRIRAAGVAGVAANASAVVLNVVSVSPSSGGFLTLWESGSPRPDTSSLNYVPGSPIANMVTCPVGADGHVQLFAHTDVDVVVDVVGFFATSGSKFTPMVPQRVVDTRHGLGVPRHRLGSSAAVLFSPVSAAVPANAKAVLANVVAIAPTQDTFFTVYPAGTDRGETSTLNLAAGDVVANSTVAMVGADGRVVIFNHAGDTDVVVDVYGYFV